MRRIVVDATCFSEGALAEAVRAIGGGGVIALPTDTLYGLAADPFRPDAVARVFDVKGRAAERALPLIAADAAQVADRLGVMPELARRLASRFWPGPLTLLLPAPTAMAPGVSGGTGSVGVRIPSHAVARALCRACGTLLTATSANLSGAAPSADPDEIERTLGDRIDILVDAGTTPGGPPSTIVDATGVSARLVREGAIAWEEIRVWLEGA